MCRATIAVPTVPAQTDDNFLGILIAVGGMFGSVGSYFLFVLIGLLRDSESPGPGGIFQRVILALTAVVFLMSAVSSVKLGYALREEASSSIDDDHDVGWIMGAADVMGINFQH